jgi:hypothetical protein
MILHEKGGRRAPSQKCDENVVLTAPSSVYIYIYIYIIYRTTTYRSNRVQTLGLSSDFVNSICHFTLNIAHVIAINIPTYL